MRALVIGVLLAVESATACTTPRPINVMHDSGVCDGVPPALAPGERKGGELPKNITAPRGAGAVIGIILQAGSGRPLPGASVLLRPASPASVSDTSARRVVTNSAGGFALTPVVPSRYELRVSLIGHLPQARELRLRADAIDTVQIELPYLHCVGY